MLNTILNNLTRPQRAELLLRGIESPLISAWKRGVRRPTYAQCISIAAVTGCDLKELLLEIAIGDAREEDQEYIKNLVKN